MASSRTNQDVDAGYIDLPWGVYEERLIVNGEKRLYSVDNDKRLFEWKTVPVEEIDAMTSDMFTRLSHAHPKRTVSAALVSRHLELLKF